MANRRPRYPRISRKEATLRPSENCSNMNANETIKMKTRYYLLNASNLVLKIIYGAVDQQKNVVFHTDYSIKALEDKNLLA